MAKTVKTSPENFEDEVIEAMAEVGDKVQEQTESILKRTVREAVSELKSTEPTGGRYCRGWSHKAQKGRVGKVLGEVIYNRTDYQLTHLLEYPHPVGKGGQYPSPKRGRDRTGTLAKIEEKYTKQYFEEVKRSL